MSQMVDNVTSYHLYPLAEISMPKFSYQNLSLKSKPILLTLSNKQVQYPSLLSSTCRETRNSLGVKTSKIKSTLTENSWIVGLKSRKS